MHAASTGVSHLAQGGLYPILYLVLVHDLHLSTPADIEESSTETARKMTDDGKAKNSTVFGGSSQTSRAGSDRV